MYIAILDNGVFYDYALRRVRDDRRIMCQMINGIFMKPN